MENHLKNNKKLGGGSGFTLIELLIVIAVMAILASVVFVALNPLARFEDARNNTRWTNIEAMISAIKLSQVDNGGQYISTITTLTDDLEYMIGTGSNCDTYDADCSVASLESNCVDLTELVNKGYLPEVPVDESAHDDAGDQFTFFYLSKNSNGSIALGACSPEQGSASSTPEISIKR